MQVANYIIQGQGHSLAQGHSDMKIKICFSQKLLDQISWKALRNKEMKINKYEFGHRSHMAAMPVYGKII